MLSKILTVRKLLDFLNQLPKEKLDYEVLTISDSDQIINDIVSCAIDDKEKRIELITST